MERKTLQEIRSKITKNLLWSLAESEREREKSLKTFEKGELNKSRSNLKKSLFTIFDWLKISFNWSKHTEAHLKILNTISIDRKTDWINRNSRKTEFLKKITWFLKKKLLKALYIRNKMHEYEMKWFSKTQVLNSVFPKLRFSKHSPFKFSNTKYVLHKLKVFANLVGQTEKHTQ